jgi:hypothetical protein
VKRLDERQVEEVFNKGKQTPESFATRLVYEYFTKEEIKAGSIQGWFIKKLDPARVEFVRSHVASRFGGKLSNTQWHKCISYISKSKSSYLKVIFVKNIYYIYVCLNYCLWDFYFKILEILVW